jgi:hypothetical protein
MYSYSLEVDFLHGGEVGGGSGDGVPQRVLLVLYTPALPCTTDSLGREILLGKSQRVAFF